LPKDDTAASRVLKSQ